MRLWPLMMFCLSTACALEAVPRDDGSANAKSSQLTRPGFVRQKRGSALPKSGVFDQKKAAKSPRTRRELSISQHYGSGHCLDNMDVRDGAIINWDTSSANGAISLNTTVLAEFEDCLILCCLFPECNVAVFDKPGSNCFLFDCGPPDNFQCKFDPNGDYMTSALTITRSSFELDRHNDALKQLISQMSLARDDPVQEQPAAVKGLHVPRDDGSANAKSSQLTRPGFVRQKRGSALPKSGVFDQKKAAKSPRTRRELSISQHYGSSHCLDNMDVRDGTIINWDTSSANGAISLNTTVLAEFEDCLILCCLFPECNVAVFDKPGSNCFLFDCGPPDNFQCKFDPNGDYTSGALTIARSSFELDRHNDALKQLISQMSLARDDPVQEQPAECSPSREFQCDNGECIAIYDACNGIKQCDDGSDERPDKCQGVLTTFAPPRPKMTPAPASAPQRANVAQIQRPGNINQWGREGERQSSAFHHKNTGIQVPPAQAQQPQQNMAVPQQQGWPLQQQGYAYNVDPNMGYSGYGGYNGYQQASNGYYQNPYGYGPAGQPQQMQNVPLQPQPNQAVPAPRNPNQAQKVTQKPAVTASPPNAAASSTTPSSGDGKGSKRKPKKILTDTEAGQDEGQLVEKFKAVLLEDLKDEDFIMETPTAAIFTLVVGTMASILLALLIACRMRSVRRRSRKRNLATDADGDYLVNGMYL